MSIDLRDHLNPQGRDGNDSLIPNVIDNDQNTVTYFSDNRLTTESTVVDIGDSPNSNTGDPLRTAFIKINNFIEASYWHNDSVVAKFTNIDSDIQSLRNADSDRQANVDSDIAAFTQYINDYDSDYTALQLQYETLRDNYDAIRTELSEIRTAIETQHQGGSFDSDGVWHQP